MVGNFDIRLHVIIIITLSLAIFFYSLKRIVNVKKEGGLLNLVIGVLYNIAVIIILTTENLEDTTILQLGVLPNMLIITNLIFGLAPTLITSGILIGLFIHDSLPLVYFSQIIITLLILSIFKPFYKKRFTNQYIRAIFIFVYILNIILLINYLLSLGNSQVDIDAYFSAFLFSPLTTATTITFIIHLSNQAVKAKTMQQEYDLLMLSLNSTTTIQVLILDDNYCYIEANDIHKKIMKRIYDIDVTIGQSYLSYLRKESVKFEVRRSIDEALNGKSHQLIYRSSSDQILKTYFSSITTNKNVKSVVLFTQDITEEKIREKEIYELTYIDSLTKTYNRHYFIENQLRYDNEDYLILLYIDVNMLKVINDAFGHAKGDELLIKVTKTAMETFKTNSEIIRMGGDEFIVVIRDHPIRLVEEELREFNTQIKNSDILNIDVSISIGLSIKSPNQSFESVLKAAEEKMYKNKLFTLESRRQRFLNNIYKELERKGIVNSKLIDERERYALLIYNGFNPSIEGAEILKNLIKYYQIGKINDLSDNSDNYIEIGYRILSAIPIYKSTANYLQFVGENYDGSGKLYQLKGEKIPIISQIVRLVYYFGEEIINDKKLVLTTLPSLSNVVVSERIIKEFIKILKAEINYEKN